MSLKLKITREKHLDHMVKVVPFIVLGYAIQCYMIVQMQPTGFAVDGLLFLGCCLVMMIAGFISYDLKHSVELQEDALQISFKWLNYQKNIFYHEISAVEISESGQTFATISIKLKDGKNFGFYFVDDADKIKQCLEQRCFQNHKAAA